MAGYQNELQMYPDIVRWLSTFLQDKYSDSEVEVHDTHTSVLNEYIQRHGLQKYFPTNMWQTYEIKVDITAFIKSDFHLGVVFAECKTIPISLTHISQLLGYSRVALPLTSYLISTKGPSDLVRALLLRYDRTDILEYHWPKGEVPKRITIAKWDISSQDIDHSTVIPPL